MSKDDHHGSEEGSATFVVCIDEEYPRPIRVYSTLEEAKLFAMTACLEDAEVNSFSIEYYSSFDPRYALDMFIVEFRSSVPVASYQYGLSRVSIED